MAGRGEEEEAAARGLGVELHDLRVVADGGDRAAEGRGGDDVGGEVEAADPATAATGGGCSGGGRGGPGEGGVEGYAAVETVREEIPLRRDGDGGGHHRRRGQSAAGSRASRGGRGLELNCPGNRVGTDWPRTCNIPGQAAGQASSSSFGPSSI